MSREAKGLIKIYEFRIGKPTRHCASSQVTTQCSFFQNGWPASTHNLYIYSDLCYVVLTLTSSSSSSSYMYICKNCVKALAMFSAPSPKIIVSILLVRRSQIQLTIYQFQILGRRSNFIEFKFTTFDILMYASIFMRFDYIKSNEQKARHHKFMLNYSRPC